MDYSKNHQFQPIQHKNQIGSVGQSSTASQNLNNIGNQKTGSRGFNRSQVPPNMQQNSDGSMLMQNAGPN